MSPIELLAKQIQQISEQNQKDHDNLNKKIDQLLTEIHVLYSERNVNEKRFDSLELGQKEIKEEVQVLKEHHIKRDHLWKWVVKVLGIAGLVLGIIGTLWKFGFFS